MGNCEKEHNIFKMKIPRFAESAVSTQREEFQQWGVMAVWARPYLTNSQDYVNTQVDMFLRLYQARHIFRWVVESHGSFHKIRRTY